MLISAIKKPNILKLLVGSILYDAVLIVAYANILINQIGKTAAIITIVLVTKKVIRTAFDIPSGVIVDKYLTPRKSVLLSIVLKIAFVSLLRFDSVYTLMLSSILEGVSLSFFRGKSSVLQYEIFEKENMNSHFEFFSSTYGIIINLSTTVIGLIATVVHKYGGMERIFIGSIIGLLLSAISIYLLPDKPSHGGKSRKIGILTEKIEQKPVKQGKNWSKGILLRAQTAISLRKTIDEVKRFFQASKAVFSVGPYILSLSTISGLACLGWQVNAINQFLAIHTMESPTLSAYVFQMGTATMSVGCLITMLTKNLKARTLSWIISSTLLFSAAISGMVPKNYAFLAIIPYLLTFNTVETGARKIILQSVNPSQRSSVISISTTATSALSTLIMVIFQLAGEKFGYQKAYFCIFITIWTISVIPLYIITKGSIRKNGA